MSLRPRWIRLVVSVLVVIAAMTVTLVVVVHHRGATSAGPSSTTSPADAPSTTTPSTSARPVAVQSTSRRTRALIRSAYWYQTSLGYRLVVQPSTYGRSHAATAPSAALRQALQSARPTPLRLTRTIRAGLTDQLHCHAAFASRKPRWDLEAWRPDVGYVRTVLAACNP